MHTTDRQATLYDRVRYVGGAFAQTHPVRLATVAALFGLHAPDPRGCRVLELGCGNGSNLVPMAAGLPEARFVGVDLAATAIAAGRERAERVGLRNLRLEQADVATLDARLGRFDYVIAHGLYSWVPPPVRAQVLRVVDAVLADDGVAYVSYNALPGCRMRHLVRELLHARFGTTVFEPARIADVRAFLAEFSQVEMKTDPAFLQLLKQEIEFVAQLPDDVLYHDDLAAESHAFTLTEVLADAAANGLKFLGEARVSDMFRNAGFPEFEARLARWSGGDRVQREQLMDHVRGRRFRQTLLCRSAQPIDDDAGPRRLQAMCVRSRLRPLPGAALHERGELRFVLSTDAERGARIDEPIAKVALTMLARRFPEAIAFAELVDDAIRECAAHGVAYDDRDAAAGALAALCWALVCTDLLEVYRDALPARVSPGSRPRLRPVVADALRHDITLTDPLNHTYRLEDGDARRVAMALDGDSDRDRLRAMLAPASDAAARIDVLLAFLAEQGALES